MSKQQPNIVFYFSDQQRWDTCGCYGQKLDTTPNLDGLAEEGVVFANAYTAQPVCGPARAMLQTGKYPTEIGCFRNNIALQENEKTLAGYLKKANYDVGYVGKWHLASTGGEADFPIEEPVDYQTEAIPLSRRGGYDGFWRAADILEFTSHGYDGYVYDEDMKKIEFKGYRADAITDYGLEYIDKQNSEKPFFLFISHIEPHHQNDRKHYEGPVGSKRRFKDYEVPEDLVGLEGDYLEEYPDYLGCCRSLDDNLGRVIDKLKDKGLYEDTIIIYTSDHGSHFRTRNNSRKLNGYDDYKRSCHDSCLHIPMVIAGPGFERGARVEELVSLISLPKTILNLAGVAVKNEMQGEDLREVALQPVPQRCDEVFIQISESRVGRALRTSRWKYSVTDPDKNGEKYSKSNVYVEEFLYDLEADPNERVNLVRDPQYTGIRAELAKRLVMNMLAANEEEPAILPAV